jgi:hypothetical protein
VTTPSEPRREPKPRHMEGGCGRFDEADDNRGADRGGSTSNRGRCKEPEHALHVFQLDGPPEPVLKQPSREEGLTCVKEREADGEPRVPPNHETARGGREEDGNGHWHARPGAQGGQGTHCDAGRRPEDGHPWLIAKSQAKPGCEEVCDARRDCERNTPRPPTV